ncbi:MAG: hypothetical protein ACLFR8_13605 [Alkalispirochaeta sp.]
MPKRLGRYPVDSEQRADPVLPPVPATDLLIAATAKVHRLELLEADGHFRMIPTDPEV